MSSKILSVSLSLVTAVLAVTSVCQHARLKAYENRLSELTAESGKTNAVGKAMSQEGSEEDQPGDSSDAKARKTSFRTVRFIDSQGDVSFRVLIDGEFAKTNYHDFVSVTPAVGNLVATMGFQRWWEDGGDGHYVEFSGGDFKYRTPYTVTVRKGLPFEDGTRLEADRTFSFRRRDRHPEVSFADFGRYLPPTGLRAVKVGHVNVTNLACAVAPVLPANIVQLLAREEAKYDILWSSVSADSANTEDLTGAFHRWTEAFADHEPNVTGEHVLQLRTDRGVMSNGVYLVHILNGDRPTEGEEPSALSGAYRLVCMTDLGLTVRRSEREIRVWVTSITGGATVPGVEVKVFAANNELLARGVTNGRGEAVIDLSAAEVRGKRRAPFAIVATTPDDAVFLALEDSSTVEEAVPNAAEKGYLEAAESTAFVWTERGIYRHGEKIFAQAILRDGTGVAPKPMPVVFKWLDPDGNAVATQTCVTDARGAATVETFSASAGRPSGRWKIQVSLPGKKGKLLGEREVKIEEFVPPQVRVAVKGLPEAGGEATNVAFRVTAEHLFGGPAKQLSAEAAVTFQDTPFEPAGWDGWRFGDERAGLNPNFIRLKPQFTDDRGEAAFVAALPESAGRPKGAVRLTVQGSVLETGGRPAYSRATAVVHVCPYYLGTDVPRSVAHGIGERAFAVAAVGRDGRPLACARELSASLCRIDHVYSLKRLKNGSCTWECETIRVGVPVAATVALDAEGRGEVMLPVSADGDYELVLEDAASGVACAVEYWVTSGGDEEIRAKLSNPTKVEMQFDKEFYREGEVPQLTVKAPFAGEAYLAVLRDGIVYTRPIALTNATSVIELEPVDPALAPNVEVAISVVQAVGAKRKCLAARAHGIAVMRVRPSDREIGVTVAAKAVRSARGGSRLAVDVSAKGAAKGAVAVVTVVDEGINLLTAEKVPSPIGFFSEPRTAWHPLYDFYGRLFPVYDAPLVANGAKTGGDDGSDLMNRVSPVPSRRFKPLALWQTEIPLKKGLALADFDLGEFVGEIRVTAVIYDRRATGSAAAQLKVTPFLVTQPDAPRFAAPGDVFNATFALSNQSESDDRVSYEIVAEGALALDEPFEGEDFLSKGDTRVLNVPTKAIAIGEGRLIFRAKGFGETHEQLISLPIRPATPWEKTSETVVVKGGGSFDSAAAGEALMPGTLTRTFTVSASPVSGLTAALEYLADYPYGCLEQTASRIFPLVTAGGFLNRLTVQEGMNPTEILNAGVNRVVSMIKANDFSMWPNVNVMPWNREVSLYAAHFLIEASQAGCSVPKDKLAQVVSFCRNWASDGDTNICAYACHNLALAGCPDKDRMNTLFDLRGRLTPLSRAYLARAFARSGDNMRAQELLCAEVADPADITEASVALLALMEVNADDPRLGRLVTYLEAKRDRIRFQWGTTWANAHALMALAAYYRVKGAADGACELVLDTGDTNLTLTVNCPRRLAGDAAATVSNKGTGEAWLTAVRQYVSAIPRPAESNILGITRRYLTGEGFPVELANLTRGELLIVEIELTSAVTRQYADLVIEDLLPACFEPEPERVAAEFTRCHGKNLGKTDWVLRSEARDDRVLAFSRPLQIEKEADTASRPVFRYAVRVVTAGEFVLPGPSVEAMYAPELRARGASERLRVR